jgi:hypothetical protein
VSGEQGPYVAESGEALALDPFGLVEYASRIPGIGPDGPTTDETYVFHTTYVPAAQGANSFTLRFTNLKARRGVLLVRVHMQRDEPGTATLLANSERIQLNRLALIGGELTIPFEGFRNSTFALMGRIHDDTDASAEALHVQLDSPDIGVATGRAAYAEGRSTSFGTDKVKASARIMSLERSTLVAPTSQAATSAHYAEPAYDSWLKRLGEPRDRNLEGWRTAYLAHVLDRYGVLQAGASAVAVELAGRPIPALVAGEGLDLTLLHPPELAEATLFDRLRRPTLCSDAAWNDRVRFRAADLHDLPEDLANFDLFWSADVVSRFDTLPQAFSFVETSMECLRPGGLAVHVFDADLHSHVGPSRAALFRRVDLERLALQLISRGHQVAQLRPATDLAEAGQPVPCGIIARRARLEA